jgi:putative Mg2+ transporter-C (MgtC) family protein
VLADLLYTHLPFNVIVVRLLLATVLAGIVGLEREARNKTAGLRTHMLVGLGAATFVVLTVELVHDPIWPHDKDIQQDPMRVIDAVVTAVGFLGGGAIIRGDGRVRGITTGAGIWAAGSIGIACGLGRLSIALLLSVLAVIILSAVGAVERALLPVPPKPTEDDLD